MAGGRKWSAGDYSRIPEDEETGLYHSQQKSGARIVSAYRRKNRTKLLIAGVFTVVILAALIFGFVYVINLEPKTRNNDHTSGLGVYTSAAVASDATICSQVGTDIMKMGGNAVDSAISSLLCLGLTDPQSMGLGGGFFMTIYNTSSGKSTFIDSREVAPLAAKEDMFLDNSTSSVSGPLAIAVPGEVKGYWHAHQRYGRLPWKVLFEPAMQMAKDGFPIPIGLHHAIQDDEVLLSTEPSLREIFINKNTGQLYKEGEIMTRPKLYKTLKTISEEGMEAFYSGSLTDDVLEDLKDIGSIITKEDLKAYKVNEKTPTQVTLRDGIKLLSSPSPGSGPIIAFIMNILEGYNMTKESISSYDQMTLTYHRTIEAFKFAYAKRTDLGDEDFIDVKDLVRNLTSRTYADEIRAKITDDRTHEYNYYGPTFYDRVTTSTSHMSILDQQGLAVAVTSTINSRFGCKLRGRKTGIIWNNEMDDFSTPNITNDWGIYPSPANFIQPGKRPLSSMIPTILLDKDGRPRGIHGAAGGSTITTATAWSMIHNLWLGDSIMEAIDRLRLHHQLLPPELQYERGFDTTILSKLKEKGHDLKEFKVGMSIVQGIDVKNNGRKKTIYAYSDYRKGGTTDGF